MKVSTTKEFKLSDTQVSKSHNDRTSLGDQIRQHWIGQQNSNIGMQYVALKDGILQLSGMYERVDVLVYQVFTRGVHGGCNIFFNVDGSYQMDRWDTTIFTKAEEEQIIKDAKAFFASQKEYVARQRLFLESKPWLQLAGLTPEEAVIKLRELGW